MEVQARTVHVNRPRILSYKKVFVQVNRPRFPRQEERQLVINLFSEEVFLSFFVFPSSRSLSAQLIPLLFRVDLSARPL